MASLTEGERQDLETALQRSIDSGGFVDLANFHGAPPNICKNSEGNPDNCCPHGDSQFLPWHRFVPCEFLCRSLCLPFPLSGFLCISVCLSFCSIVCLSVCVSSIYFCLLKALHSTDGWGADRASALLGLDSGGLRPARTLVIIVKCRFDWLSGFG